MATTTNFGWETPDDTDLVKDGALAMRTLGNAIDASLVDLKGGTTGQVLSKNSNTDMDFTWVTSDDANAIQNAIVDAKGDLITATAADTPSRLAVGNNGESLVADSSASTGLRWTAGNPIPNPVLNSAMQIWQRGTSISLSASTAYTADRWQGRTGSGAQTISRQATGDTTNLPFIQYCARVGRNSGNTGTGIILFEQSMETINSIPFVGKTVTLSFYARRGANFSGASNLLYGSIITGTGTDQNVNAYTGGALAGTASATLTTTWQRFTVTATIPTTANEIALQFEYTPTGTAGAADYYEITGVQLDIGSVALPFRTNAATLAGELAACQRYYWRNTPSTAYGLLSTGGGAYSTTQADIYVANPVPMRIVPTIIEYSTLEINIPGTSNTAVTALTIASGESSQNMMKLGATVASGLTASRVASLRQGGSSSAYVGFSAEL